MDPVWIVDDDASIRFVLEKALARENLETRSFTQTAEVFEALEAINPQDPAQFPKVVISDIRMPGGSGLEMLEHTHVYANMK